MTAKTWPDFYVIGAGKSGTTSLYQMLRHHRQIYLPVRKEPNYFSERAFSPHGSRLARKEYLALYQGADGGQLKGDFSTSYFLCPEAPARIRARQPAARFIVTLRDPVARAFSDYLMLSRREGRIRRDFFTEVSCELERLRTGIVEWPFLVKTGLYATNIKGFLDHFPRERFLFLSLGELIESPEAVYESVCNFLGVGVLPIEERRLHTRANASAELRSTWLRELLHGSSMSRTVARITPARARNSLGKLRRKILYRPAEKPAMPKRVWPLLRPVFDAELDHFRLLTDFDVTPLRKRWPPRSASAASRTAA